MQSAPPNKQMFDAGYRKRYPRGCAAHEEYERACERGADADTLANLNAAYAAACTADEKEHVGAGAPDLKL